MRTLILIPLCAAVSLFAQTQVVPTTSVPAPDSLTQPWPNPWLGETNLRLDVGFGIRFVPPSRVTVPEYERVSVTGPLTSNFVWTKDGRDLPGATTNPLILSGVTAADAGVYVQSNRDPVAIGKNSQSLVLTIGPTDRLLNLSTRGWVGGADQPFIGGFVVSTQGGTASKKLILRAIGPSLSRFGVTNPVKQPTLRIYDA